MVFAHLEKSSCEKVLWMIWPPGSTLAWSTLWPKWRHTLDSGALNGNNCQLVLSRVSAFTGRHHSPPGLFWNSSISIAQSGPVFAKRGVCRRNNQWYGSMRQGNVAASKKVVVHSVKPPALQSSAGQAKLIIWFQCLRRNPQRFKFACPLGPRTTAPCLAMSKI